MPAKKQIEKSGIAWAMSFFKWKLKHFTDSQRFVFLCVVVGVLCGFIAVGFHLAIHYVFGKMWEIFADASPLIWLTLPLMPAVGGLFVGIALYKFPSASGSGIPQTKAAFHNNFGLIRFRDGILRFIISTISLGTGTSLGREGPTVHLCAAVASKVGQVFGLAKNKIQAMIPVGVGAGIASAFNTPISAITFVFEELLDDFNSKALGGILLAVVIAATIARAILGENPAFQLETYTFHSYSWVFISPIVGLSAGVAGIYFVRILLAWRERVKESNIPVIFRPALGGLAVGIIGVSVFLLTDRQHNGIFGIGYEDLSSVLAGNIVLKAAILLLIGKFVACLLAYSFGGSGGLFAPVLFIGGMLGGCIGLLLKLFWDLDASVVGAVSLLGMGAFFAAVIRCPITSILIIFEMTLNYEIILPLMIGNMLAYYISNKYRPISVYNELLLQDKINLRNMPSFQGAQDWRNLPISAIMTHDVITISAEKTIAETLIEVKDHKHHAYPVRKNDRTLCGIITDHDMKETTWNKRGITIEEFLKTKRALVTLTPDVSIREAARVLVQEDVMQVPVVRRKDQDRLVGIITLHDVARAQNSVADSMGA